MVMDDITNSVSLLLIPIFLIIRALLQLLGNYSLAGEKHQFDVWSQVFPHRFLKLAGVRSTEICDPLCMVIYTCCKGTDGRLTELCTEQGLPILIEILLTASSVGLKEDSLKLLLRRICISLKEDSLKFLLTKICIEGYCVSSLFVKLHSYPSVENDDVVTHVADQLVIEQSYLLSILSEILNEQIKHIIVSHDFALSIFGILKSAAVVVDFSIRGKSGLPMGSAAIDVLGYSHTILRLICTCDHLTSVVDALVLSGLVEFLLDLLRGLEPPTTIRKAMKQDQVSSSLRCCPYQGFRSDIVAILANCSYRRRHVQDEIRDRKGIILLLQQGVVDEDNPFFLKGVWNLAIVCRTYVKGMQKTKG